MIELVTFDWNGTLLADTQACVDVGNQLIRMFGGTPLPREQYIADFDFPTIDFYRRRGCDVEELSKPEHVSVFHDFYEPRAANCHTRRGAREIITSLQENSIDSVILSNHIREAIIVQLVRLGILDRFSAVLANNDYGSTSVGNNKIGRMENYLSQMGVASSDAIIVGDSPEDIGIGKSLGMGTVAITGGYFSTSRLKDSNPDYLIGNLTELKNIVESS